MYLLTRRYAPSLAIIIGSLTTIVGILAGSPWLGIGIGLALSGITWAAARRVMRSVDHAVGRHLAEFRVRYIATEDHLERTISDAAEEQRSRRRGRLRLISSDRNDI